MTVPNGPGRGEGPCACGVPVRLVGLLVIATMAVGVAEVAPVAGCY